jgi:hypothetical protein
MIRVSPVRITPGWHCWPRENCPLSPAGEVGSTSHPLAGLGDGDAPPLGLAVALLGAAIGFAVWARARD